MTLLLKFQLCLSSAILLTALVHASILVGQTRAFDEQDPRLLYALFSGLVWLALLLALVGCNGPVSYNQRALPLWGSWAISFVFDTAIVLDHMYGEPPLSLEDIKFTVLLFGGVKWLATGLLLASAGLAKRARGGIETVLQDEETRPLLSAARDGSSDNKDLDKDKKEDDEDEKARKEIRERPWWKYLASFMVFLPHVLPRTSRQRFCFAGMLMCSVAMRGVSCPVPCGMSSNSVKTTN